MSQLFNGSLCLTDINNAARGKHSAFTKGQNGKIYFNLDVWLNDEEDKYGNLMSFKLHSKKDFRETEGSVYIGNGKVFKSDIKEGDIPEDGFDPFEDPK